ncbi:MAG: PmoA family protein [Pirellulales bacterium]|nr:PmoA family protein [Pirellulales bacterium]
MPSNPFQSHLLTLFIAVALAGIGFGSTSSAGAAEVEIIAEQGKAVVKLDGEFFAEYRFAGYAKPILYPIVGPHGVEMTRNYPMKEKVDNEASDHPHHKSLWYTHDDVNGVRFWLEDSSKSDKPNAGKIIQREMKIEGNAIVSQNEWTAPDGKVVCQDQRIIAFGKTDVGRFIDYTITLKASSEDVVFGDTKEGSMGIRTHPMLRLASDPRRGNHTAKGQSINSEGVTGKAMWGKRAKWVDYWAPVDDNTVGIAIFDHPSNPRHPTWWHARHYGLIAANPFGVHDFEGKPKGTGDLTIPAGESITFHYRFLFHRGDHQQADIPAQYELFTNSR